MGPTHTFTRRSRSVTRFFCVVVATMRVCGALLLVAVTTVSSMGLRGIEEDTPCTPLQTCGQCAVSAECGWGETISSCLVGTDEGPSGGNCTDWSYGFCQGEACGAYAGAGCQACVMDPFCGFCAESNTCMEGTVGGPLQDDCAPGFWFKQSCAIAEAGVGAMQPPPAWTQKG